MRRYLTTKEYADVRLLVDSVLSASTKEEAEEHIKAFDTFRNTGGFFGSVGSILAELLTVLRNSLLNPQAKLSYFTYADSHLNMLREYIRED